MQRTHRAVMSLEMQHSYRRLCVKTQFLCFCENGAKLNDPLQSCNLGIIQQLPLHIYEIAK